MSSSKTGAYTLDKSQLSETICVMLSIMANVLQTKVDAQGKTLATVVLSWQHLRTIDEPKNCQISESGTRFHREVTLCLDIPEFL